MTALLLLSICDAMLDILDRYPASPEARMWPWLDDPAGELGKV